MTTKHKKSTTTKNIKKSVTKKKTSLLQKYKDLFARDKLLALLIAGILFIAIALCIWGSLVLYEKHQFTKAEQALDSLQTDIIAELGEPVSSSKSKSCGYSSAKYGKGTLGCGINYVLEYDVIDASAANTVSSSINALLNKPDYKIEYYQKGVFIDGQDSIPGKNPAYDLVINNLSKISLSVAYKDIEDRSNASLSSSKIIVSMGYTDSKCLYRHYHLNN